MLGLTRRKDFMRRRFKSAAIELTNKNKTSATQVPAVEFLKITYPATVVLKVLKAAKPKPGKVKSHLMLDLYKTPNDNIATRKWLKLWNDQDLSACNWIPPIDFVNKSKQGHHVFVNVRRKYKSVVASFIEISNRGCL